MSIRLLEARSYVTAAALLGLLASGPAAVRAQSGQSAETDSAVLASVHDLQRKFEEFRESRTPIEDARPNGICDELIGRICVWFGGDEEDRYPAELPEVQNARVDLIRALYDAFDQVKDRWIIGQLVNYLVEARTMDEALRVATECGIPEQWWCSALRGYVLHKKTEYVDAESAFREALSEMPEKERFEWTSPRYVFTPDATARFDSLPPAERQQKFELLWRLSDPLFLFEGNDRLTDHFARWVVAINRRDAADPLGLDWGADLEETLIRYGMNTGYGRTRNRMRFGSLEDTRRMVGHHPPKSRGYLFPEQFLDSPSDIPPESWITAPRKARTWYSPPYAPEIRELETQVGRFRRADTMLVVGAYRPTVPDIRDTTRLVAAWRPGGGIQGTPYAALFLVPEDGSQPSFVRGSDAEGVLSMKAPPGRYVSSLEVVDLEGRQAWRARQGVVQRPLEPGMVDVSDLMILKSGSPLPTSLDEGLPNIRPGIRLKVGERFPVMWEVYGLRVQEPVRVTIGFTKGRPGFLARVGDFLGIIQPPQPVEITFDDTGPDVVQTVFRSVELSLPDLDPGEYTLHLRLDLAGRTPLITSRPIIVER